MFQNEDKFQFKSNNFKVVSKIKPSNSQMKSLLFAFNVCRYVKSNANIMITTHAIEGLSENDFILASKIDKISNV